jgi:hypothetical protein
MLARSPLGEGLGVGISSGFELKFEMSHSFPSTTAQFFLTFGRLLIIILRLALDPKLSNIMGGSSFACSTLPLSEYGSGTVVF